jgi:phage terminase small subunit
MRVLQGGTDRGVVRPLEQAATIEQPDTLPAEVAAVWAELAPHATKAGTLVGSTGTSFRRLCQAVVMHGKMTAQIERDGLTYLKVTIDGSGQEHTEVKAHPLISKAQAMDNAIRAWFKDFGINPFGKPLTDPAQQPVDPFASFEQAG